MVSSGNQRDSTQPAKAVLLGTNHLSDESSVHVRSAIRRHDPDVVAVEFGPTRGSSLAGDDRPRLDEARESYRSGGLTGLLIHLALSEFYQNADPPADGGDMIVGARTAAAHGRDVALIDRDIHETIPNLAEGFKRDASRDITHFRELAAHIRSGEWKQSANLATNHHKKNLRLWYGLAKIRAKYPDIRDNQIPPEALAELREVMQDAAPETFGAILTARDDYLASRIHALRTSGRSVVAVLGALHVPGVQSRLSDPDTLTETPVFPDILRPNELEHLI